jgi:hypothetical protein
MPEEHEQSERVLPLPAAPDAVELRHLRAFVAVAESSTSAGPRPGSTCPSRL